VGDWAWARDHRGVYETALVPPSLDRLDVGVAFTHPVTYILSHALRIYDNIVS